MEEDVRDKAETWDEESQPRGAEVLFKAGEKLPFGCMLFNVEVDGVRKCDLSLETLGSDLVALPCQCDPKQNAEILTEMRCPAARSHRRV